MSFSSVEITRAKGQPITLYLLVYGTQPSEYFAFNDGTESITYNGKTYSPTKISRSNVQTSGNYDNALMQVSVDFQNPFVQLIKDFPPSQVIALTIFQGHANDAEFLVTWTGSVASWKRNGDDVEISANPVLLSLERSGLRRNYQYGCPHQLYGSKCKANEAAFTINKVPTNIFSNGFDLPAAWAITPDNYLGGMVTWVNNTGSTERRSVLDVTNSGLRIILSGPTSGLDSGETVSLTLGCPRTTAACANIFNNINNYGGQPYIPLATPIGIKNNFY